jgi:hypothetical protein
MPALERAAATAWRRAAPAYSTAAAAVPGDDAGAALAAWVRGLGGATAGAAVAHDARLGLGLRARRAARAGAELVALPPAAQLSYSAASDPRLLALVARVPPELWAGRLALALLAARAAGASSPHAPYVAALPRAFPGVPTFFGAAAVAALDYPPLAAQVARRARWLHEFAAGPLAAARGDEKRDPFRGRGVDAGALGWALAAASSRAFRPRGAARPAALLPLIDFANHDGRGPNARVAPARGANSSGADNDDDGAGSGGALALVAARDLAAGEPIRISYGALPNDFLLLDYGFVEEGNPHDDVALRFDPAMLRAGRALVLGEAGGGGGVGGEEEGGAVAPWRARALAALGLAGPGAAREVRVLQAGRPAARGEAALGACPVDARFLAGARVASAAAEGELAGRAATAEALGAWAAPLSAANERAALAALAGCAALALGAFGASADEDAAALAGGALGPDEALAVRFRREKKRLLAAAMEACARRLRALR